MNLEDAPKKIPLKIISIDNEKLIGDAYRFGIEAGNFIEVVNIIPGGPVVIQKNEQQLAIGRELAKEIKVEVKN